MAGLNVMSKVQARTARVRGKVTGLRTKALGGRFRGQLGNGQLRSKVRTLGRR